METQNARTQLRMSEQTLPTIELPLVEEIDEFMEFLDMVDCLEAIETQRFSGGA